MVGAGKAEGAMDAGNMLKPALARGELHCVGATTLDEYRKYIEKDAALERRFQKVLVDEPSRGRHHRHSARIEGALRGPSRRRDHRSRHRCRGDASHRYISDRQLPDKAIDLIDEAGSLIRMEIDSKPEALDKLDRRIIQLKIEREALKKETDEMSRKRLSTLEDSLEALEKEYSDLEEVWKAEKASVQGAAHIKEELERARTDLDTARRAQDLARMSELQYGRIPDLEQRLAKALEVEKKPNQLLRNSVTEVEIAEIVSKWTGIPVSRMLEGERDKLLRMEEVLGKRVVGPGRGGQGGGGCHSPLARGAVRSEPPQRLVHVSRADRRRQDGALQGFGGIHVRHRRGDGAHRHVGIHGEAFRRALDRRAAGLCGL